MPSKTETGLEHICFWAFPNPLWGQANCCKCLEFCYNKYSIELELVLEYYHFSGPFLPHVSLNRHQKKISIQLCLRSKVHQSPGPLSIRPCSTNGPWSSARIYCSDFPHPGCLPSSSLESGLLTSPTGGRNRETESVLLPNTNSAVGPHLGQSLQGRFFRVQVLQHLICAL